MEIQSNGLVPSLAPTDADVAGAAGVAFFTAGGFLDDAVPLTTGIIAAVHITPLTKFK